jgi:hypothetical protein
MLRPRHPPRAQADLELVRVYMQELSHSPSCVISHTTCLVVCVLFGCDADSVVAGMPLALWWPSSTPAKLGQWVASLQIVLSMYEIREMMRDFAAHGKVRAPPFLEFLERHFQYKHEAHMYHHRLQRVARILLDPQMVPGHSTLVSDLPFLCDLVKNPPSHKHISWNYLAEVLPLLLKEYRTICPTTGTPNYDEVRRAMSKYHHKGKSAIFHSIAADDLVSIAQRAEM